MIWGHWSSISFLTTVCLEKAKAQDLFDSITVVNSPVENKSSAWQDSQAVSGLHALEIGYPASLPHWEGAVCFFNFVVLPRFPLVNHAK